MGLMGWESAKREMKMLSRFNKYIESSTNSHASYYILQYSCKYMESKEMTPKNKPAFAKNELRKVHQVDYHRNGISGIGFYSVRYDWADYDGIERRMLATIEVDDSEDFDELLPVVSCRVLDIDEPETSWRGDSLAPKILHMIAGSK